jgi:hypothetical protein
MLMAAAGLPASGSYGQLPGELAELCDHLAQRLIQTESGVDLSRSVVGLALPQLLYASLIGSAMFRDLGSISS